MGAISSLPETFTIERLVACPDWILGRSATYEAVRRGDIPSFKIGRRIFIPKEPLERLLSGESISKRVA